MRQTDVKNLPALLRSNENEKNQRFCRIVKDVNNYTGADCTSQIRIEFDWHNPHPYQRTTRFIKKYLTDPFFLHHIRAIVKLSTIA